jgi:signal transduction histidine kinase
MGEVVPILPTTHKGGRPGSKKGSFGSGPSGVPASVIPNLLRHSGVAVYVFDLETDRLYVNNVFRDIYNHIVPNPVPDDALLPLPESLKPVVNEIRRTGKRVIRAERVHFGARTKHHRAYHFPVYRSDELIAVAGLYHDVTRQTDALDEARQSQTRLDDVIRSTSDWVWEIDDESRITFMSDRITEALGYPPSTLVGRKLLDVGRFVQPEGRPNHGGRARRIHLSGVPVFGSESGKLSGFRGTGTDITARHLAEETARQSKRDLEAMLEELRNKNLQLEAALDQALIATKAKSEFLATMSHELRTPLNAIIGFAEVIQLKTFGNLPPKYESYVEEIVTAGRHLLVKINDILDVAKAEDNALPVFAEPTPLREIIDGALAQIGLRATEKRIDMSGVRVDDDWLLQVDPERADQVFINVLSNAIKFSPERGVVGLDVATGEEGMLDITVWDTGIGIPPEKQETIFESFHQIHDGIFSRAHEGTGIGLTVARHMARLMGGEITLESTPGMGSRFTVSLPLAKPVHGEDAG